MTNGPQDPVGPRRGDEPEPSEETLRRLEERLDRASEVAERLIVEAAARVAQDPDAGQPPSEDPGSEAGQPPSDDPGSEAGQPPSDDPGSEAGGPQPEPERPQAAGERPPLEPERPQAAGERPPPQPERLQRKPEPERRQRKPEPERPQRKPEPGAEAHAAPPPPAGWQRRQDDATGSSGRGELDLLLQILSAVRDRIPPELQHRLAEALREVLLAIRALIDWYLERTERRRSQAVAVEDIPIV